MPVTNFSPLLGLALPTTGDLSGTWGVTVNDSITSLLDSAISGTTSITVDADTNLTSTNGAADQSRQAVILWNPASGTTTRTITAPAKSKLYTVINASGGTQSIVFRATGQTGVTIVKGESALLAFNGTDFIKVSNTAGSGSFTNLTVSGTTTLSGLTASTALALDASKNVVSVTNTGTGNNVLSASPTFTGTLAAAAANFSGAVALGDAAADNITVNGTVTSNLIFTDNTYDIGASGATRPRNLFLAGNATVGGDIVLTGSLDLTNLEVTNIKAKDGTAGMQIADSTGVVSFTSNPVLTSGTALGVVLLNASKQMQAVAALTYDQGVFTNDGPTIVSNDVKATGAALTRLAGNSNTPGTTSFDLYQNATAGYVINRANSPLVFGVNDAEQMRLTSTGLGIGTSSPLARLTVSDSSNPNSGTMTLGNNATFNGTFQYLIGPGELRISQVGSGSLGTTFYTNGAERMRLDSSGNLGLGVTPSAWTSSYKALQVGLYSSMNYGEGKTNITTNAYYNGTNWIYANSDIASMYKQGNGHIWYTAPSGTAGNAISFTQAMTLDASGNLLVGTTSAIYGASGRGVIEVGGSSTAIAALKVNGAGAGYVYHDGTAMSVWNVLNGNLLFGTNNTERARITSGGDLLVGKTANDTTTVGVQITSVGIVNSAGTTDFFNAYSTSAAAYRFYISNAGTISATNTAISAISDQRFKENIQDLDVGLDKIMALKPRKFDWKEGKGKDIKGDRGFIAQEFEQVFPDLIDEWKDPAPEGEAPYKSVRQDLIPVLVKAIQELKAEFDAYKASHP